MLVFTNWMLLKKGGMFNQIVYKYLSWKWQGNSELKIINLKSLNLSKDCFFVDCFGRVPLCCIYHKVTTKPSSNIKLWIVYNSIEHKKIYTWHAPMKIEQYPCVFQMYNHWLRIRRIFFFHWFSRNLNASLQLPF